MELVAKGNSIHALFRILATSLMAKTHKKNSPTGLSSAPTTDEAASFHPARLDPQL
jgi:hypothetical protein